MSPAKATVVSPCVGEPLLGLGVGRGAARGEGHRGARLGQTLVRAYPIPRLPPVTRALFPVRAKVSSTASRVMGHRVPAMRRWSEDDLRLSTLRRQFPKPLEAVRRPTRRPCSTWSTGSPRSSPRCPGPRSPPSPPGCRGRRTPTWSTCSRATDLVKASTLRGTVFTSGQEQFGWSQRIAREGRAEFLAAQTKVAQVARYAACSPRSRTRRRVAALGRPAGPRRGPDGRGSARAGRARRSGAVPALGPGRPAATAPDTAWHKRTDVLRRSARVALPELAESAFDEAVLRWWSGTCGRTVRRQGRRPLLLPGHPQDPAATRPGHAG